MPTGTPFRHTVTIDGLDIAGIILAGATIDYGIKRDGEAPTPASAYMTLISADALPNVLAEYPGFSWGKGIPSGFTDAYKDTYEGPLPRMDLGVPVQVDAATPTGFTDTYVDTYDGGFESTRFTGYITAIDVMPGTVTLTAVTAAERLTRVNVDPSGWVEEYETTRVERIATAAGVSVTVTGPNTVIVTGYRDTETPRTAWAMLTELAATTDAVLYTDRTGAITYRTRAATGGTTTDLADHATLLDGLQMTTEAGAVVNVVTVEYGPPDARAKVTRADWDSIGEYGPRDRSFTTLLAAEADAEAFGDRILSHYANPVWHMPAVTMNLRLAEESVPFPAYLQEVLTLDLDDSVHLPALLPAFPESSYTSRVLGYREVLDPYAWSLTFSLNPAGWTKP